MRLPWTLTSRAVGLLLLRVAVLVPLLAPALAGGGLRGVLLWATIVLLLLGLLTPLAALGAVLQAAGAGLDPLAEALAALALAFAGGGRLSLDGWLFGPRLILDWPRRPG